MKNPDTDLMVAIEDNRAAVMALGELLVTTMEHGGSELVHLGMGVHVLFRLIEDDAKVNMEAARDLNRKWRASGAAAEATDDGRQAVIERLEGVDAAQLAEWANVDQEAVERVLGQLLAAETSREEPTFTRQDAPKRARR